MKEDEIPKEFNTHVVKPHVTRNVNNTAVNSMRMAHFKGEGIFWTKSVILYLIIIFNLQPLLMELETLSFLFLLGLDSLVFITVIIVAAIVLSCRGRKLLSVGESKDFEQSLLAPGIHNGSMNTDPYSDIEGLTEGLS